MYLIPKDEVSVTDQKNFRTAAVNAGIARAVELKIAGSSRELAVRQFENILDAGAALEQWNTAALAAVGTAYSVFQAIANPTLAANKLAVFYKVACETAPVPISLLTFRSGTATGNIIAEMDCEQIINGRTVEGYFSECVVIDPVRMFAVQVMCRIATAAIARVQLGVLIIEPAGQRVV